MAHPAPRTLVSRLATPTTVARRVLAVSLAVLATTATPAISTASVVASIAANRLDVVGDAAGDAISLRLASGNAAQIEVLVGAAVVGSFPRDAFDTILVDAGGGDDVVTLDAVNGVFTDIELTTVRGGLGSDILIGQGADEAFLGGDGNDTVLAGDGDDTVTWNPGDDNDVIEGQGGVDSLVFNGANVAEIISISANGQRVLLFRNVANIVMDMAGMEVIAVNALGGNDVLTAGNGLTSVAGVRFDAGSGDDSVTGGSGNDLLLGGPGLDTIDGGAGDDTLVGGPDNDTVLGGAGADRLLWSDGDGSDVNEGGPDSDVIEVNGSPSSGDTFTIVPNGARVQLDRLNLVAFSLDIGTAESLVVNGLGGNDTITASNGLAALVALTLDGGEGNDTIVGGDGNDVIRGGAGHDTITPGRGNDADVRGGDGDDSFVWNPGDGSDVLEGDGGVDTLVFNGSNASEIMTMTANGERVVFSRNIGAIEMDIGTSEKIVVNALGGNDTFTAATGVTAAITFDGGDADDVITGGDGNDTLTGGAGVDTIFGGLGNDVIVAGLGNDIVSGGPGNDAFTWNPGDGSDTVDGEDGTDTLVFNGAQADEVMGVSANGQRVTLTRNVGAVVMDLGSLETAVVFALGGNDTFAVSPGIPPPLTFTVYGGDGNDVVQGGDGSDFLRGDAGVDILSGGAGDDILAGGPGNDSVFAGPGDDRIFWDDGDGTDVLEGEAGADTVQVTGSTSATGDVFTVAPNGPRVKLDRTNLTPFSLDIGTVEALRVDGSAGNDTFAVAGGLAGLLGVGIFGGPGVDVVTAPVTSIVNVVGGLQSDTLTIDALNQPVALTGSSVAVGGQVRTTYSETETVNVTNTLSALPSLAVTNPPATATSSFIQIAGTAADDGQGVTVTWSTDRGASGVGSGSTSWTARDIPVLAGNNVIDVTIQDASGNRVTTSLVVAVTSLSYYLAEGATGSFFDLELALANPSATDAPVDVVYLKGDGTTVSESLVLSAQSRRTVLVDGVGGLASTALSAVVTSTSGLPLAVERTMSWDQNGYGAHTEKATPGAALRWYFAEGSEQAFFDTYLLLANPQPTANRARVQFLVEGGAPVTKTYDLLPTSRTNVFAEDVEQPAGTRALLGKAFGIVVTFDAPGVAERAMYFGASPFWNGGHESAGVNEPGTSWFLAEGATGPFFDTYVLLSNPGNSPANAELKFLLDSGGTVTRTKAIPANGRVTVAVESEDAQLASAAMATQVTSDHPIVVERAMYWAEYPNWYEAHNTFGVTGTAKRWVLGEGRVGGPRAYDTYVLLANPGSSAAMVTVTYLRENGLSPLVTSHTVGPTSRYNVVPAIDGLGAGERFGVLIESSEPIVVERAMYSSSPAQPGLFWAAGTNATGTPLP